MHLKNKLSGQYKIIVLNSDDSVAYERDWQPNLITDEGLHNIFTAKTVPELMEYCVVGTGNAANVIDSTLAGITATCSGTTVTASAPIFASDIYSDIVGRTLKFDTGETARITALVNSQTVTISQSFTVAAPTDFAIWRTNITALVNQTKQTNTYSTLNNGCGTFFTGTDSIYHQRTFDFATEVSNQIYSELGVGWLKSSVMTLFSRILITGGSVTILAGQRLRIVYQLYMKMAAGTYQKTAFNVPISGFSENTGFFQIMGGYMARITAASGATDANANYAIGEPINTTSTLHITQNTGHFIPFDLSNAIAQPGGAMASNTQASVSLLTYTSGSFFRDKRFFWDTGFGNMTGIKTIRSWNNQTNTFSQLVMEFNTNPNAKTNLQTFSLWARIAFTRELANP